MMIYRHKLKGVMGRRPDAGGIPLLARWLLFGLLILGGQGIEGQDRSDLGRSRETALTRSIEQVAPAVAGINVVKLQRGPRRYSMLFDDPIWSSILPEVYRQVESLGSGLVISSDGYVVTNAHVVENAAEVIVTLTGGHQYKVEQIFSDPLTDIALLKIEAQDLPGVKLGDSNDLIIGEWVIALGNPLGLFDVNKQPTATVGIISGLHMDFGHKAPGRVYQDMIQTDASINSGNSGGPLVNAMGEVIGINSFIFTGDEYSRGSIGIGFAIPINRVKEIVSDLITKGRVNRDIRTGLVGQPVDRYLQAYLGLSERRGFLITSIDEASAGEQAGLKVGDVILEVNGRAVNSKRDFINIIDEDLVKVGDVLELTIWRGGAEVKIPLKLG